MGRLIFDRNKYALLATALFVSFPLIIYGLQPKYLVAAAFQPRSESAAQILCKETLTQVDGAGVAHFDFCSVVPSASDDVLFFELRPAAEGKYYRQGDGYRVVRGMACGVAQLGSPQWPLYQSEEYAFRLVDRRGAALLDGKIIARVHSVTGASHWVLLVIGVLASVLQVLVTFWPGRITA